MLPGFCVEQIKLMNRNREKTRIALILAAVHLSGPHQDEATGATSFKTFRFWSDPGLARLACLDVGESAEQKRKQLRCVIGFLAEKELWNPSATIRCLH